MPHFQYKYPTAMSKMQSASNRLTLFAWRRQKSCWNLTVTRAEQFQYWHFFK